MRNKLLYNGNTVYRVIGVNGARSLVIDCLRRTTPFWVDEQDLIGFNDGFKEEDLLSKNSIRNLEDLSQSQLKEARLRFATISHLLPCIGDDAERRVAIEWAAKHYKLSEQTIRRRLWDYLAFQTIAALAPREKEVKRLTEDEKNFRWALNKYFYNSKKISLKQAFKYLIKEKYMDQDGNILQNRPRFHQFRYFYYKTRSESNFIISRLGRGEYDRNYRPLLGEGVRSFCPTIGYGMLDSTVCDIYLVNEAGELIGRPILAACVDAYSSMCLGYSLGWEGGIKSLRKMMCNVITNKVEWCRKFGIEIEKEDWDCEAIPHKLITDMGTEYAGDTFANITELGIEVINLEPYRPELKSVVERFFGLVQDSFKKELIDKGVVLKDFGDRGVIDYRKNACLTLEQFEKVLLLCIIHYNCGRKIELPLCAKGIKRRAKDLWNWRLSMDKDALIRVKELQLRIALLPRCAGKFKRDGLIVNRLRYKAPGFTDAYLKGESQIVAYDPEDVSKVWLLSGANYTEFELINSELTGLPLSEAKGLHAGTQEEDPEELESEIKLTQAIELATVTMASHPQAKNLRRNRQKEIKKAKK